MRLPTVLSLSLLLLLPSGAALVAPTETTDWAWQGPYPYHGPDGCTAPPFIEVQPRSMGRLLVHDEDGDGAHGPLEQVILSRTSTVRQGDVVLVGLYAGLAVDEGFGPLGATLLDLSGRWSFHDVDGDEAYSRGDVVYIDFDDPSTPEDETLVASVGDVPYIDPARTKPWPHGWPTSLDEDHGMVGKPLLPLEATYGFVDVDGDGRFGAGHWDTQDQLRLMRHDHAALGDILLLGPTARTVVSDLGQAELPLELELEGYTLLRVPSTGRHYLGTGYRVAAFDVRVDALPHDPRLVLPSDHDHGAAVERVPGHLAFLRDPESDHNGAPFWDVDADGVVDATDVPISHHDAGREAGKPLLPLDAPLRALDVDWDGRLSEADQVVVDVDGNGRLTLHDIALMGREIDPIRHGFDRHPARLFQPSCLDVGYMEGPDPDGDGLPGWYDPDPDHDGWGGRADNCPLTRNTGQSDMDGDGHGDACDNDLDGDGWFRAWGDVDDHDPRRVDGVDTDGDGIDDPVDPDADGDGTGDVRGDAGAEGRVAEGEDRPGSPGTPDATSDGSVSVPAPAAPLAVVALVLAARLSRRTR